MSQKYCFSVLFSVLARNTLASVIVKKADVSELQALRSVFVLAIEETGSVYTVSQRAAWVSGGAGIGFWEELLRLEHVAVAYELDQLCGFASMNQRGDLSMLYVHPDFQRKGVGARLIQHIVEHATEEGYAHLRADASVFLKPLLLKLGFELIEEYQKEVRGQKFNNAILMRDLI